MATFQENEQGFITGGMAGAGTGAAIGATVGSFAGPPGTVAGAAGGAAIGFIAGGLLGNMQSQSQREARRQAQKEATRVRRQSIISEMGARQQAENIAMGGMIRSTGKQSQVGVIPNQSFIGQNLLTTAGTF